MATLLAQKSWSGDSPLPFHAANALLAGAAAAAAFWLFSWPAFGLSRPQAAAAAALFGLHPVLSSCVYPVSSGRQTLLLLLLALLTASAFLRKGRRWRLASWIFFAGALFGKEQSVALPPLLLILDLLRFREGASKEPARGRIGLYAPFIGILAVYAGARWFVFRHASFPERLFSHPWVTLLQPAYAWQQAVAPRWDLVYEPVSWRDWFSAPRAVAALAAALLAGRAAVLHPARRRAMGFWAAWFGIALLPSANIMSQDVAFDERYAAVSLAGAAALCVTAAGRSRAALAGAAGLALWFGATAFHRGDAFRNDDAFTAQWVRAGPDNVLAHYSRGVALGEDGRADEAAVYYARAIALRPDWAPSYLNLGSIRLAQKRYDEAIGLLAGYAAREPGSAKASYSLGVGFLAAGRAAEAERHFRRALELDPRMASAYHNLGLICESQGRLPEAIRCYESAVSLEPGKANSLENLARLRRDARGAPPF